MEKTRIDDDKEKDAGALLSKEFIKEVVFCFQRNKMVSVRRLCAETHWILGCAFDD
ncbi:MAG: hypothetical protein QXZ70_05485 [Candidatus Bathyarchaeia archaeon]